MANANNSSILFQNYEKLPGIPPKLLHKVRSLCGPRYIDLLLHLPSNIIDRTHSPSIDKAEPGDFCTFKVKVCEHFPPANRRSRAPYKIWVTDGTANLELLFFNHGKWLKNAFTTEKEVIISGKVDGMMLNKQIIHPEYFSISKGLENIAKIEPIYPLTSSITNSMLQKAIAYAIKLLKQENIPEWLDDKLLSANNWPSIKQALLQLHNPSSIKSLDPHSPARVRLAFDELFLNQATLLNARTHTKRTNGIAHTEKFELRKRMIESLPFNLTGDQNKAIDEIDADMSSPVPMVRLIQGDVGSGKTLVAFSALLRCIEGGMQGVLMAPTEVLAIQHFENAQKLLTPLGVNVELLTGKLSSSKKKDIKAKLASGMIDLAIGTHALVQDDVILPKAGLIVVDEQHRFGVKQRLALSKSATPPDLLVMTATPIPRTLSLTYYGDMDISIIQEKPPGRTPIITNVLPDNRLHDIANSLKRVVDKGEQAYWVCPLVEESEKTDLIAATDRFEFLYNIYGDKVALLHGRMKGVEKEKILHSFRSGETKILVSTTVIEVGIDVPQSTVMVIEHAERFGLAQLHQLRGRVGRGGLQSTCLLLYSTPVSEIGRERLETMRASDDGFVIAEKDLELRGPGEVLGTRQAGHIFTKIADLSEHKDLIPMAREIAEEVLKNQTNLNQQHKNGLRFILKLFDKENGVQLLNAG